MPIRIHIKFTKPPREPEKLIEEIKESLAPELVKVTTEELKPKRKLKVEKPKKVVKKKK